MTLLGTSFRKVSKTKSWGFGNRFRYPTDIERLIMLLMLWPIGAVMVTRSYPRSSLPSLVISKVS